MFFNKTFLKIAVGGFLIFALFKNKMPNIGSQEKEIPKFEFIKDIQSSIEVLTAEPKNRSLTTQKEEPILPVSYDNNSSIESSSLSKSGSIKSNTSTQSSINQNKIPPQKTVNNNEPNSKTWLEHKLVNIADNLLHTPQGQELLEKFLLNKKEVPENIKQNSKPKDPHHNNSIIEVQQGTGKPVQCGDLVTAHYVTRLVNGQEIENTHYLDKPLTFQVGNQQVIKGLEYAALGMQAEGIRRLVVPPKMAYNKAKFSKGLIAGNEFVTVDVELLKVDQNYQNIDSKIRIFNNESDIYNYPIMCSDPVFFNYSITTLDNKLLAKSESQVHFILGSDSVPPAINKAFADIKTRSKRSVIIPSNLLYNQKISFLPPNVKLPSNELILLEIDTN